MSAIILFQIIVSLAVLAATGNVRIPDFKNIRSGSTRSETRFIFSSHNKLPSAQERPAPPRRRRSSRSIGVDISAAVAAVIDMRSGKTLFEKKADMPMPLASLTKLMTALVVLDAKPKWEDQLTVTAEDVREGSSSLHLGESGAIKDIFNASLIASENTATALLARGTGLTEEEFISRMNAKAEELGMLQANFADVTGLDPKNTATALDVAVLARAAFFREEIKNALMTPAHSFTISSGEERRVRNTDRLLDGYLNKGSFRIQGGKTGYIEESGFNFVFEVKGKDKQDLIVVVFGSESKDARFEDAKNLALWAFENFDWEE